MTCSKIVFIICVLAASALAQSPIVFHAVNCKVTTSENRCIGCTSPSVPVYTCDAYVSGGTGTLWPTQSAPAKLFSLVPIPTNGTLPAGMAIDPKVGLIVTPNPVGCYLGEGKCGARPLPPANVGIQVQ